MSMYFTLVSALPIRFGCCTAPSTTPGLKAAGAASTSRGAESGSSREDGPHATSKRPATGLQPCATTLQMARSRGARCSATWTAAPARTSRRDHARSWRGGCAACGGKLT
eukprot:scaffold8656_cov69-Phaeocystis_antarctica.AAC.13